MAKKREKKVNLSLCTMDEKQNLNSLVNDAEQPLIISSAEYEEGRNELQFEKTKVILIVILNPSITIFINPR